jgi:hypothetical protein
MFLRNFCNNAKTNLILKGIGENLMKDKMWLKLVMPALYGILLIYQNL